MSKAEVLEYSNILLNRWSLLMLRAFLTLGLLTLLFWLIKPKWVHQFRIHQPQHKKGLWQEEIARTVMALSFYSLPLFTIIYSQKSWGYTKMYTNINDYGVTYFVFSIFIFALFNDAWFYWTHRLMHKNRFLKKSHSVHHRSYNTNPFSSFSFDIVESFINIIPFWILVMLIPWHPLAVLTFSILSMLYIGYIHLGYDFYLSYRVNHSILKWFYSSTHHARHHQNFNGNYSLYFTFWDKIMGTELLESTSREEVRNTL